MSTAELIRIRVAEIVVSVLSDHARQCYRLPEVYDTFTTGRPSDTCVTLRHDDPSRVRLRETDKLFDSGAAWALYRHNGGGALLLGASARDGNPYGVALFDSAIRRVDVLLDPQPSRDGLFPDPLQFPLGEVLMICLLAAGRGLMIHACGIDDGGRGLLFAGNSTHGKTTMARLWREQATVLNDDRIVLRRRDGQFFMYGTPWHGEHPEVAPTGLPLEKIFFLHHAESTATRRCRARECSTGILARSFPPLWDREAMGFTLDLLDAVSESIPCFDLGFAPEPEAVEAARCAS